MSIREDIVLNIKESEGASFDDDPIQFEDIMDIILLYLSLALKTQEIKMSTSEFENLLKDIWSQWLRKEENSNFSYLYGAHRNGPGPMGGTASRAEIYLHYLTKICAFNYVSQFFKDASNFGWQNYKNTQIIPSTLPKWKKEENLKNIGQVIYLAETIWKKMESGAKT